MTKAEVADVIGILKARYPRATWGPDDRLTVEAWHMSLGDVALEPVLTALRKHFQESVYAPDPVDIRGWILADAGIAPDPADAWAIAQGAIRSYYPGFNKTIDIPDAVRNAINAIGGMHTLKMSETPSEDRDAFLRAYATHRKRALSEFGLGLPALGESERPALS